MARQIYAFAVTVPAGTPAASPLVSALTIPTRVVDEVEILVPPGPSGRVGFRLGVSGTQLIPYNAGAWIVTDNERVRWPLEDFPDSGAWSLIAYNTGAYDHSLEVRFLTSLVGAAPPSIPVPLSGDLSGSLELAQGLSLPQLLVGAP